MPSKLAQMFVDLTPEIGVWSARNFPESRPDHALLGVYEEFGELSHALLKSQQGIRGTAEQHHAAQVDALADMAIFAMDFIYRGSTCACEDEDKVEYMNRNLLYVNTLGLLDNPDRAAASEETHRQFVSRAGSNLGEQKARRFIARMYLHGFAEAIGQFLGQRCNMLFSIDESEDPAGLLQDVSANFVAGVVALLSLADEYARQVLGVGFVDEVRATWGRVKARDWIANPLNANVVAEATVASADFATSEAAVEIGGDA